MLDKYLDPKLNPFIRPDGTIRLLTKSQKKALHKFMLADDSRRRMKRWWKLWRAGGNKGPLKISQICYRREAI